MEDYLKQISEIEKFEKDRKLSKLKMTGITTNAHEILNANFDLITQFNLKTLTLFGYTDDQLNKLQNLINTRFDAIETQMNIFYEKFEEMLSIDVSRFVSLTNDNIFNISTETTDIVENFVKSKLQNNDISIIKNKYGIMETTEELTTFYLNLLSENQKTPPEESEINAYITEHTLPEINAIKETIGYVSVGENKPNETGVGKYYIRKYTRIGGEQTISINDTSETPTLNFNLYHYTYDDNRCDCVLQRKDSDTVTIGETSYTTEYLKYNSSYEKYNLTKDSENYVLQNGNRTRKFSNSSVEIEHFFYEITDNTYGVIIPYSDSEWKLEKPIFEVEKISNKSEIEFEYRLTHIIMPLCYYKVGSERKLFSYKFSLEDAVLDSTTSEMIIDTTYNDFAIKGSYQYKN